MQRDLKITAAEIDVHLRKVDKILTTRWVASSSRAVESFEIWNATRLPTVIEIEK